MEDYIKNLEEQIEFYRNILKNINKEKDPLGYTHIEIKIGDLESELIYLRNLR